MCARNKDLQGAWLPGNQTLNLHELQIQALTLEIILGMNSELQI